MNKHQDDVTVSGPDIAANRNARKWSPRELRGRAAWELVGAPLFALSPRPLWEARSWLLRLFGARVGRGVHIHPSVRIAIPWNLTLGNDVGIGDRVQLYCLGEIVIADRATVSQNAHLCGGSHNYRDPAMPLLKMPIVIGAGAWVCADAFVGPGVKVGALAIVGARAVAMRDVADNAIVIGNPARQTSVRYGHDG